MDSTAMISGRRPSLAEMVGLHMAELNEPYAQSRAPSLPSDRNVFDTDLDRESPPLGFGPTTVAAGASVALNRCAQAPFSPYRLIVPRTISAYFTIEQVDIGHNGMLDGPLPASVFDENAVDPGIEFEPCPVGRQITLVVRNEGSGPLTFTACLLGAGAKKRTTSNARVIATRDPIRLCDYCGAPPKRGHASDACYYCQRKR